MLGEGKLVWQKTLSQGFASSRGTSSISVLQQMGGKGEWSDCTNEKTTKRIIMWEYVKKVGKERWRRNCGSCGGATICRTPGVCQISSYARDKQRRSEGGNA